MEGYDQALTQLEDAVTWLKNHDAEVPRMDQGAVALRLKEANKGIWRLVNHFEAGEVQNIYDTHALIKAMAKEADEEWLGISEVWLKLIETGALAIRGRKLLAAANALGVDPRNYVDAPKEEE